MITHLQKTQLLLPALILLLAMSCSRSSLDEVAAKDAAPTPNSMIQYQYTSLIGNGSQASDANVMDDGMGNVVVNTQSRGATSGDIFAHHSPHILFNSTGWITPNDGHTYWAVPFDPQESPARLAEGGGNTLLCDCLSNPLEPGTGDCVANNNGGSATCTSSTTDPCSQSCSFITLANGGSYHLTASMLLRADNSLVVNGLTYQ